MRVFYSATLFAPISVIFDFLQKNKYAYVNVTKKH